MFQSFAKQTSTTLIVIFFVVLALSEAKAQQTTTSVTDGSTPSGLQPGSPAGSYALSGFDNVNLYNGNLNFQLPLTQIRGRGSAQMVSTLALNVKSWHVSHFHREMPDGNTIDSYKPTQLGWRPYSDYGAGRLSGRNYGLQTSSNLTCTWYSKTLSRITFSMPGGTEFELRDQQTNGQPLTSLCNQGANRGKVFVTADGTAATFISDADIIDNTAINLAGPHGFTVSGYLMLRDGTRYRIDGGNVTWIRDRNGNTLSFAYTSNSMTITDSLNRTVTVNYNVSDVAPYGLCDQIIYTGFAGAQRIIRVSHTSLQNVLRSGYTIKTLGNAGGLFPELTGGSPGTTYNPPDMTSAVWLPDGRSYKFYYNSYGELARVEVPTGGAVEYDMTPGSGVACAGSDCSNPEDDKQIYRRVVERRVYPNGGSGNNYELREVFTNSETVGIKSSTVTREARAANGTVVSRTRHYFDGSALNSLFTQGNSGYGPWYEGHEKQTDQLDTTGNIETATVLRRVVNTWAQQAHISWWTGYGPQSEEAPNNPRLIETVTTIEPSGANLVSKSSAIDPTDPTGQTIGFDQFNNPTDVWEYGYGQGQTGALLRHTHTDYVTDSTYTDAVTGSSLRSLPSQSMVYNGSGTLVAKTSMSYDETAFPLLTYTTVTGWIDPGTTKRGNPTTVSRWLNINNTWLPIHRQFDQCGSVRKIWDPADTTLINPTLIEYSETYKFAFPTSTTSADPDLTPAANGPGLPQTSTKTYDLATGLVTAATDQNNVTTVFEYNDSLDRLKRVIRGANTNAQTQTSLDYDDTNHKITRTSDKDIFNDNILKMETFFDGMGRTTEYRTYEGGTNFIAVQIQYDTRGRAYKTSNPYRPWQNESPVWTTQQFDALDRVTSITTPDNAVVTSSYSGNTVTVTDQAGKVKKTTKDALGRVIQVIENPGGLNYETTYLYDALDNLIKVTQGSQQRFFLYDSLQHLIRARNPEQEILSSLNLSDPNTGNSSWTTGYQYDAAGNMTQKTDPRGVTSTYVYDALNRNTAVDYSDTTPDEKRFYDGATNGIGRFWYAYKGDDATANNVEKTIINEYDPLGKPLAQQQLFKLNNAWKAYPVSRTYNLAGEVLTQTYPSNRTVSYTYDSAGRTLSFSGYLGDGTTQRTYATGITYSSWGSVGREQFGTNTALYRKSFYNIRGQLFDTRLSSVNDTWDWNRGRLILYYSSNHQWGQSGTDNNGNVRFAETWIPPENATLDQADTLIEDSYNYDGVNRLTSVAEQRMTVAGGWGNWQQQFGQQYNYDQWGNRTILDAPQTWGTGINRTQFTVDTATNRIGVPTGQTAEMIYDKAGNLTKDTYTGGGLREYDAENKMTRAQGNGQWQEYTYNADGQRVRRKVNGQETWQIHGMQGELIAEYAANGATSAPQKEYGYRNGELLVTATITSGWGAQPVIHDNPLVVNSTTIQARHITELRDAINALRSHLNLAAYSWQQPLATGGAINIGDLIKADPILEMRTALDQALGAPANGYAAGLAQGQPIKAVHIQELRDRVLATWNTGTALDLRWLVTDNLGTPRMVVDLSGSLANINRHDYLPFGEELVAGVGGRTTTQGYIDNDGLRQGFTSYERDAETSLDYAHNRYHSPVMGRFTSVDPDNMGAVPSLPQSWNGYSYAINRPTFYVDPDGLKIRICNNDGQCTEISDEDARNYLFNKEYARNNGFVTDGNGGVWDHNGQKIGTYTRTSFDDLTDDANDFLFQAMRRTAPIPRATWEFFKISVKLGTRIGAGWAGEDVYSIIKEVTSPEVNIASTTTPAGELFFSEGPNNLVGFVLNSDKGELRILTSMSQEGDTLVLDGFSIEGPGANSLGPRTAREYAREIGKSFGAKEVLIKGGLRTTGANPGRIPKPVTIKVY